MSIQNRLARLEQLMRPACVDHNPPCDVCGAPGSTIHYQGVRVVLIYDERNEPKCEACGRWLDDATGQPISADYMVCLIRATDPSSR